jgi:hypothetical protein
LVRMYNGLWEVYSEGRRPSLIISRKEVLEWLKNHQSYTLRFYLFFQARVTVKGL